MACQQSRALPLVTNILECGIAHYQHVKLSLVQPCLHRPTACDMTVLGMQQSTRMTQSVGFRVLKAIKPVVQAYEDVKRMDFGMEESFLVKKSFVNTFSAGKDLKRLVQQLKDVQKMDFGVEMTLSVQNFSTCRFGKVSRIPYLQSVRIMRRHLLLRSPSLALYLPIEPPIRGRNTVLSPTNGRRGPPYIFFKFLRLLLST
ncbi:hypothetical protein ACROYT_G033992 [Oculina patagonica]